MTTISLAQCIKGDCGVIKHFEFSSHSAEHLKERLLDMGFIEGASLSVSHLGGFRGDPIAIRIGNSNTQIALRKKDASSIFIEKML